MTRRRLGGGLGWQAIVAASAVAFGAESAGCSSTDGLRTPDPGVPLDSGAKSDSSATDGASSDTASKPDGSVAPSGHVVISQVYGGGGSADATFTHDFVELFNARNETVSLRGWSLQYASAMGTGNFGATETQLTELPDVSLRAGQYYLVQLAQGTAGTSPLPAPDFVDPTPINMSATAGKLALVNTAMPLGCNGGTTPCAAEMSSAIVDLIGYGASNYFEGPGPATATSTTSADFRAAGGCIDTDDNAADFAASAPSPRNMASPLNDCSLVDAGPPQRDASTGDIMDGAAADALIGKRIRDIQGRAHFSPLAGSIVQGVPGVVTAVGATGFYLQDPSPDTDDATSEGIFVYTSAAPTVAVGDSVLVIGTVDEFRPSCASCTSTSSAYSNLTTTEIRLPTVTVMSSGNALPPAIVIGPGTGERHAPATVIDDDTTGNVEIDSKAFDPANDGIDFYESLEGMRVAVNDAVAVGPTSVFTSGSREIPVIPAAGAGAGLRTARGGIVVAATDWNPERIVISNVLVPASPDMNVGDKFMGTIVGVIDYAFAKYNLLNTGALPAVVSSSLVRETVAFPEHAASDLDIASFNVENLDPTDPPEKFARLAGIVVQNLKSPDIVAVEEIQDDNGATDDGTVDASTTFTMLAQAITTAGGPTYQFRAIDPENDKDGGEPGGNIRVGFLFRTDRGLAFTDRGAAVFDTVNTVTNASGKPQLAYSPGRIDPMNAAFSASRKPLAAEFTFRGRTVFVIANHFVSKGGDQPLFGRFQPPTLSSGTQRLQQTQIVAGFVSQILAVDPNAPVIVLGDFNDFEFSVPVVALKNVGLAALIETLPANERYSYVYEGNSQTLDHLLVSSGLLSAKTGFDVVHVNAEFLDQASDHDPSVARFTFNPIAAAKARPDGVTDFMNQPRRFAN
jgi:predicted extracellular nuclease